MIPAEKKAAAIEALDKRLAELQPAFDEYLAAFALRSGGMSGRPIEDAHTALTVYDAIKFQRYGQVVLRWGEPVVDTPALHGFNEKVAALRERLLAE